MSSQHSYMLRGSCALLWSCVTPGRTTVGPGDVTEFQGKAPPSPKALMCSAAKLCDTGVTAACQACAAPPRTCTAPAGPRCAPCCSRFLPGPNATAATTPGCSGTSGAVLSR